MNLSPFVTVAVQTRLLRVIQGDREHATGPETHWHLCKQSKLGRRCILQCSLLRAVSLSHTPTSILLLAKSLSNHLLLRLRGRGSVSTNPPFKRKWFYFVWLHIQTRTKKAKNFEHATTIFVPIHLCNARAIIEKFCCSLKMEKKKNENANRGGKIFRCDPCMPRCRDWCSNHTCEIMVWKGKQN